MNHIGEKHGRLTIVADVTNGRRLRRYRCICECGKIKDVDYGDLTRAYGGTKSCGCYRKDRVTSHGKRYTRLYSIYHAMMTRTEYTKAPEYKNYGGRGIRVCDEWRNSFESFYEWAISNGYSRNLSIDRIDVNGNYSPENCKWSTRKEQMRNRTDTLYLEYKGRKLSLADLAEEVGMEYQTLYSRIRIYGWNTERALTTPIRSRKTRKK